MLVLWLGYVQSKGAGADQALHDLRPVPACGSTAPLRGCVIVSSQCRRHGYTIANQCASIESLMYAPLVSPLGLISSVPWCFHPLIPEDAGEPVTWLAGARNDRESPLTAEGGWGEKTGSPYLQLSCMNFFDPPTPPYTFHIQYSPSPYNFLVGIFR